jgi:hypothetical protein
MSTGRSTSLIKNQTSNNLSAKPIPSENKVATVAEDKMWGLEVEVKAELKGSLVTIFNFLEKTHTTLSPSLDEKFKNLCKSFYKLKTIDDCNNFGSQLQSLWGRTSFGSSIFKELDNKYPTSGQYEFLSDNAKLLLAINEELSFYRPEYEDYRYSSHSTAEERKVAAVIDEKNELMHRKPKSFGNREVDIIDLCVSATNQEIADSHHPAEQQLSLKDIIASMHSFSMHPEVRLTPLSRSNIDWLIEKSNHIHDQLDHFKLKHDFDSFVDIFRNELVNKYPNALHVNVGLYSYLSFTGIERLAADLLNLLKSKITSYKKEVDNTQRKSSPDEDLKTLNTLVNSYSRELWTYKKSSNKEYFSLYCHKKGRIAEAFSQAFNGLQAELRFISPKGEYFIIITADAINRAMNADLIEEIRNKISSSTLLESANSNMGNEIRVPTINKKP